MDFPSPKTVISIYFFLYDYSIPSMFTNVTDMLREVILWNLFIGNVTAVRLGISQNDEPKDDTWEPVPQIYSVRMRK